MARTTCLPAGTSNAVRASVCAGTGAGAEIHDAPAQSPGYLPHKMRACVRTSVLYYSVRLCCCSLLYWYGTDFLYIAIFLYGVRCGREKCHAHAHARNPSGAASFVVRDSRLAVAALFIIVKHNVVNLVKGRSICMNNNDARQRARREGGDRGGRRGGRGARHGAGDGHLPLVIGVRLQRDGARGRVPGSFAGGQANKIGRHEAR